MENLDSPSFKVRDATSYDAVTGQFDHFTERFTLSLASHMVSLAEIAPAAAVLDIGTGTGVVALRAAQMLNSDGSVCGIDLSEEMLAKADGKAKKLQFDSKIQFRRMDAEKLDFEDGRFDVAVSLFALPHFPNPFAALREIHRVLRPDGRLVLAFGSGAPLFSPASWLHLIKKVPDMVKTAGGRQLVAPRFLDSIIEQCIPKKNEPTETDLAEHSYHLKTGDVIRLIKEAGFNRLKTDWHGGQEIIETPEEFWELQRTFSSFARRRMTMATASEVDAAHGKFIEKCRAVQSRGGTLVYPSARFMCRRGAVNF